ncbi:MAG TPA: GIY-YIG nuclease family protein [Balneolales bacterium]|nr:GIY-YIG nuclease family protein [Balneolales bacterium]
MTNDLVLRIYQHKEGKYGFTARYRLNKLVYYEWFDSIYDAITREKQIKSWSRKRKMELIESLNPDWNDLYNEL